MLLKQVNLFISVASQVLRFLVLIYGAVIFAKFAWWVFEPSNPDVYVAPSDIKSLDSGVKFIINRAPFGVVPATTASYKPAIASEIKLTGVYVAGESTNSLAFYQLDNKSYIAKIGDSIGGTATLKSVLVNSIILTENNMDGEVKLSISKSPSGVIPANGSSGIRDNVRNTTPNINRFDNRNGMTDYNNQYDQSPTNNIASKRKLVEDFLRKNNKKTNNSDEQDDDDDNDND